VSQGHILVERTGAAAWVTISNPDKRNAMSLDMWRELDAAVATLETDPGLRVIVLRGAGGKAFVSGADISEFGTLRVSSEVARAYDAAGRQAMNRLRAVAVPTVAMIEGFCLGGGVLIALCCDLRYAASDAVFSIPAARVGLGYDWWAVKDLLDGVGPSVAKEMLFVANTYYAEAARSVGLINRVIESEWLLGEVTEIVARIASNAPLTIRAAKQTIAELVKIGGQPDTDLCDRLTAQCLDSEDYREGHEAFLQKRTPRFEGK